MAEVKNSKPKPIDYKSKHLQWAKDHKHNFIAYGFGDITGDTYVQLLHTMYFTDNLQGYTQDVAHHLYRGDKKHYADMKNLDYYSSDDEDKPTLKGNFKVFLTIGFIKENHNYDKMVKFLRHVFASKWVCEGSAVLEFNGKEGYRPHTHIEIEAFKGKQMNCPSDVADRIYKILTSKRFNGLMEGRNNIDYKYAHGGVEDYINGDKQESKQIYVDLDTAFREKNNIPHIVHS